MSSPRLVAYLALEREMLALDAIGDSFADQLRDAMDSLWYALTDEEHALLDARQATYAPRCSKVAQIGAPEESDK